MALDARVEEFQSWASQMLGRPIKFQKDEFVSERYVSPEMSLLTRFNVCWVKNPESYNALASACHARPCRMESNPNNVQWIERIPEKCDWVIAVQEEAAELFLRKYGKQHGLVMEPVSARKLLYDAASTALSYIGRMLQRKTRKPHSLECG